MRLYLVQHAESKREEEDPARPLSERGWEDIRRVAGFLKERGIRVSKILHSGKLRAKQTAEALAEAVRPEEGVKRADALAPLDDPNLWADRLREEVKDLMLVGHLPHLAKLAGLLLVGDLGRKPVEFRQGGIVCLAKDETGNWSALWILTPELLASG